MEESVEMSQKLLQTVSDINILDEYSRNSFLDPLHYAKQMLENPLGVAEEFLSFDKVLEDSRRKLFKVYGVPEINVHLIELDEVLDLSGNIAQLNLKQLRHTRSRSEWNHFENFSEI